MMFRPLLFLTLFSLSALFGSPMKCAKERFAKAHPGDYIVTEQNKIFTFLTIAHSAGGMLVLEEISIPTSQIKTGDWKQWYEHGSPGATSHVLYEFDLENETISRCYSPSRRSYLEPDTFFITLLTLPLEKLSEGERKKIGPAPLDGPDMRKVWSPPLVIAGKKRAHSLYDVMRLHWPKDETLLSSKQVDLYFDQSRPHFPFPCWIEISDGGNTFKIRSVDSGSGLTLHALALPSKPPSLLPAFLECGDTLTLTLDRADNLPQLYLFAHDLDSEPSRTLAIPFRLDKERITIEKSQLKRLLTSGHRYKWLLVTDGEPEIEHPALYTYSP